MLLDRDGILRIDSRVARVEIEYDQKFPISLPDKHYVL